MAPALCTHKTLPLRHVRATGGGGDGEGDGGGSKEGGGQFVASVKQKFLTVPAHSVPAFLAAATARRGGTGPGVAATAKTKASSASGLSRSTQGGPRGRATGRALSAAPSDSAARLHAPFTDDLKRNTGTREDGRRPTRGLGLAVRDTGGRQGCSGVPGRHPAGKQHRHRHTLPGNTPKFGEEPATDTGALRPGRVPLRGPFIFSPLPIPPPPPLYTEESIPFAPAVRRDWRRVVSSVAPSAPLAGRSIRPG